MSIVVETPRLVLRYLDDRDAAFMLDLMNDPDWLRFIGDRGVRTLDDAGNYLGRLIDMYAAFGFGLYCVESKETRRPLGICGLIKRDALDHADLGFAFMPEARGAGLAHEAAAATLAHAREALDMRRIVAVVSPGNARSIGLLENLGFRLEGPVRLDPKQTSETLLYGVEYGVSAPEVTRIEK